MPWFYKCVSKHIRLVAKHYERNLYGWLTYKSAFKNINFTFIYLVAFSIFFSSCFLKLILTLRIIFTSKHDNLSWCMFCCAPAFPNTCPPLLLLRFLKSYKTKLLPRRSKLVVILAKHEVQPIVCRNFIKATKPNFNLDVKSLMWLW